jgi:hypothetical protein
LKGKRRTRDFLELAENFRFYLRLVNVFCQPVAVNFFARNHRHFHVSGAFEAKSSAE